MLKLIFLTFSMCIFAGCAIPPKITDIEHSKHEVIEQEKVTAYFYLGGLGNGYYVKIDNKTLSYGHLYHSPNIKWANLSLNKDDLLNLEKIFKYNDIQEWNTQYKNPLIQDGTHWIIKYKSKTFEVDSRGSNSYPPNFKEITNYISKELLKGKPFR